jgi:RNA polymerase sigma-70 factor (ECF subfamily)
LDDPHRLARFEQTVLPHLQTAYHFARWLTGNDHDAEDVVQEAFLKAFAYFASFRGGDSRAWLLTTVRNSCYTWLQKNRGAQPQTVFDEELHSGAGEAWNPEVLAQRREDAALVRQGLAELPPEYREVLVLRELEGFSYQEIAVVIDIPVGTVMSRLARARDRLQRWLAERQNKET